MFQRFNEYSKRVCLKPYLKYALSIQIMSGLLIVFTITDGDVHDSREAPNLVGLLPEAEVVI